MIGARPMSGIRLSTKSRNVDVVVQRHPSILDLSVARGPGAHVRATAITGNGRSSIHAGPHPTITRRSACVSTATSSATGDDAQRRATGWGSERLEQQHARGSSRRARARPPARRDSCTEIDASDASCERVGYDEERYSATGRPAFGRIDARLVFVYSLLTVFGGRCRRRMPRRSEGHGPRDGEWATLIGLSDSGARASRKVSQPRWLRRYLPATRGSGVECAAVTVMGPCAGGALLAGDHGLVVMVRARATVRDRPGVVNRQDEEIDFEGLACARSTYTSASRTLLLRRGEAMELASTLIGSCRRTT